MNKLIISRAIKFSLLSAVIALLAACGSSDGPSACSSSTLVITSSWTSNGVTTTDTLAGQVGVALIATPTIIGIPASCLGQETFGGNAALPAGLSLNTTTGVISGTPTLASGVGANGLVKLQLPGYGDVNILNIINISL